MATSLREIGSPEIGQSFALNRQVATGSDNRVFTRMYECRVEDRAYYTVPILNPSLYDAVYPLAIIVGQEFRPIPGNKTDLHLLRHFAEIPTEWNEPFDRFVPMPAVSRSSFYGPGDFPFRSSQVSLRTDVRVNRAYFLASQTASIPRYSRFRVLTAEGIETTTITDDTTPSVDEWIAMVNGRQEFVVDSVVVEWRGAIRCRETTFAVAK